MASPRKSERLISSRGHGCFTISPPQLPATATRFPSHGSGRPGLVLRTATKLSSVGFEPTAVLTFGLRVRRLNHSATRPVSSSIPCTCAKRRHVEDMLDETDPLTPSAVYSTLFQSVTMQIFMQPKYSWHGDTLTRHIRQLGGRLTCLSLSPARSFTKFREPLLSFARCARSLDSLSELSERSDGTET